MAQKRPREEMTIDSEITALFTAWNEALATRDPKAVVALYASDAVLLPTLSSRVRRDHEGIEDYFAMFLARGPHGVIDESVIRRFGNVAINSGIYTFTFDDGTSAQARFTLVYERRDGEWMIIEHHSSFMPD